MINFCFKSFRAFYKNNNFLEKSKTIENCKNLLQNVKSRIGIRDSKFLAYSYTPTSSFNFTKNHFLKITFYEMLQNPDFWKF